MLKREYLGFALLGYFLAVIFDAVALALGFSFSVLALALAALAIVLIIMSIKKLADIKETKAMAVQQTPQQGAEDGI